MALSKVLQNSDRFVVPGQYPSATGGDVAGSGALGEFLLAQVDYRSPTALASGVALNMATLTLTPGDWEIWAQFYFTAANAAAVTLTEGGVTANSGTLSTAQADPSVILPLSYTGSGAVLMAFSTGRLHISSAASVPVYAVAKSTFTGAQTVYGALQARRVR